VGAFNINLLILLLGFLYLWGSLHICACSVISFFILRQWSYHLIKSVINWTQNKNVYFIWRNIMATSIQKSNWKKRICNLYLCETLYLVLWRGKMVSKGNFQCNFYFVRETIVLHFYSIKGPIDLQSKVFYSDLLWLEVFE